MKHALLITIVFAALSTPVACSDEKSATSAGGSEGSIIAPDTADNWWTFTRAVNVHLQSELSGAKPPGGLESWGGLWLGMIQAHESTQKNAQKYVRYIIVERRKHGLPDLPGYAETDLK